LGGHGQKGGILSSLAKMHLLAGNNALFPLMCFRGARVGGYAGISGKCNEITDCETVL
jgi:hypothetical protein